MFDTDAFLGEHSEKTDLPARELTYPTWGKGKSSQKGL